MSFMEGITERLIRQPDIGAIRERLNRGSYEVAAEAIAEAVMLWHMNPEVLLRGARTDGSRPRTPR